MRIAILTSPFFHDAKEVTRTVDGKPVKGKDRIIYGGGEKYIIDLCHLLQSMNHVVTVYQPFFGINTPFAKEYKGIRFVMIPNNGRWEYSTCTDLNWQFNELSALDDMRIYFASFLCWPNVVSPCIAISHGIYWDNIQGNNIINNLTDEQRKEFFKRQLYGFIAPDVVVSVDSNVRKVIQAMQPGTEKRIQIIYNYVDTKKFYPAEKKDWEGINVLFPRRLTALRGSTEITRAFMRYPQYNFTLVGQAHDENAAQAFFKGHADRKNVTFIHKETDEMPEVYRQTDISVIPTISCEGLSLSLLESMASGLSVITTPVGGLGDAAIHGYNAIVYDPNHEDLGQYIDYLAKDIELREKFGKRNREIATECFDIEIWKARWRNLLAQFGAMPEKQYSLKSQGKIAGDALRKVLSEIPEEENKRADAEAEKILEENESKKPKLVAMMLTHNEAGRYLERVIENTLKFCDEIVILDDHSTDDTIAVLTDMKVEYGSRIFIHTANTTWDNESRLRKELLECALQKNPDWLIAIDADELYEAEEMQKQLPYLMSQTEAEWVGFRFYDMWDEEHYRDDDVWPAGNNYAPRMFRHAKFDVYAWPDMKRHCGSIPTNVLKMHGMNSSVRVKHLGWMKPEDRMRKYKERVAEDPNSEMFPRKVYEAILDPSPTLVKWDDDNPWQTSKLTIAYPPGMEWNIMQQRPHHLLRLAADERNRVFFGDDSAPGTYEPVPYLTVVNDFESVKEVDILYVTSPEQMGRCSHIKYKKLIYDCCDWMNGADEWLIKNANYVFCTSKLLKEYVDKKRYELWDKKSRMAQIVDLPNACDFDHFSKAGEPSPDLPEPIVGYMGCIHPVMIDEAIVKALADKFKLLMIGQNKGLVFNHPNIYVTGHVQYKHLPELLSQCKVGIIPFRTDSDYLKYSAPIKVYEYLAASRPVVASPIPELQPLADTGLIRIVPNDDLEGWVKAVKEAIQEYPNVKGVGYAKTQTWENRYEVLKQEVLNHV